MTGNNKIESHKINFGDILLGIILPFILIIGGYFLFQNDDVFKDIYQNFGLVCFIVLLGIAVIFFLMIFFPKQVQKYCVFLVILIAIFTLFIGSLIEQFKDTLFSPETIVFIQTAINNKEITSTSVDDLINEVQQIVESTTTPISILSAPSMENKIIEYIDNVNQKIIIGLGDTQENWNSVKILFCSSRSKINLDTFYSSMTRKYGGYEGAPIRLTSLYSVKEIVKTPIQNKEYMWEYAQIEKWDYIVYQNQSSERTDSALILVNYEINQIGDDHFCVYDYSVMDPDLKYLLTINDE